MWGGVGRREGREETSEGRKRRGGEIWRDRKTRGGEREGRKNNMR
jgi:hypothetical protein